MEKTVTKKEVERVLKQYLTPITKEPILNELFPPEFRVGDYFICHARPTQSVVRNCDWVGSMDALVGKVMKVGNIYLDGDIEDKENGWSWAHEWIRHATPEEIAEATWEKGKEYRVWNDCGEKLVRVASNRVGWFYTDGCYIGNTTGIYTKYEKL